jgi:hypothetical protein
MEDQTGPVEDRLTRAKVFHCRDDQTSDNLNDFVKNFLLCQFPSVLVLDNR